MAMAMSFIAESLNAQTHYKERRARRHTLKVPRVHHRVVARRAHVRYVHLPRWRASVAVIPSGSVIIKTKMNPYYFHQGVYYAPRNNDYVVVRPVAGVRIHVLPVGYRRIVLGQRNYYYYYGTFYTQADKSDEYETIDAPVGAVVDALPDGYEVKIVNGTEYYVLDVVYYSEVETNEIEGGIGYEVAEI